MRNCRLASLTGSQPTFQSLQLRWLTRGNTSEVAWQQILSRNLATALGLLAGGEDLVEIGSP